MEIKLHQKEKQKNRLASIAENTMLVFSLASISEDIDEVCKNVKEFIETGQVVANKDLHIPTIPCYQRIFDVKGWCVSRFRTIA